MSPASGRQTYWHVVEITDPGNPTQNHSFTVANNSPHLLRWIAEPHLASHRIVTTRRHRANSGASFARFELESRSEPGSRIILHAQLISLTALA